MEFTEYIRYNNINMQNHRFHISRIVIPCLLLSAMVFSLVSTAKGGEEEGSGVLAYVDGTPITAEEVERFTKGFFITDEGIEYWDQAADFERRSVKADALNMMIERKLLLSEANKMFHGRQVEQYVEQTVDRIVADAAEEAGSRMDLIKQFHRQGITFHDWKQFQADTVLIQNFLGEKIDNVHVRPVEMKEYYRRNKSDYEEPAKIHIRRIFIAPTARESDEEVKQRAERILAFLDEGADFGELARNYCMGGDDRGGLLTVEVPEDDPDFMPRLVEGLEVGEVSDINPHGSGYVIAKLEDITPALIKEFSQVQEDIRSRLLNEKRIEKQTQLIANLRGNAEIQFTEEGQNLVGDSQGNGLMQLQP